MLPFLLSALIVQGPGAPLGLVLPDYRPAFLPRVLSGLPRSGTAEANSIVRGYFGLTTKYTLQKPFDQVLKSPLTEMDLVESQAAKTERELLVGDSATLYKRLADRMITVTARRGAVLPSPSDTISRYRIRWQGHSHER